MTIRGRLATSLAVLLTVLLTGALTSGPMSAAPAAAEDNCFRPQEDQAAKPDMWAQRRLGLSRIRPLTTGKGVVVAVIDSGIDVTRQHLAGQGKVIAGRDVLGAPGGPSTRDCNGHGTGVAAILAGRSVGGLPFAGVAPDATLLSIRAVEKGASKETNRGSTAQLVAALAEAVAQHARVINISAGIQRDDPALRAAVRDTLAHDIVIVASAGNDDQDTTRKPEEARKPYYPAAYPGVIAVAATDKVDQRSDISHVGSYVDIAAPGEDVMTVAANARLPPAADPGAGGQPAPGDRRRPGGRQRDPGARRRHRRPVCRRDRRHPGGEGGRRRTPVPRRRGQPGHAARRRPQGAGSCPGRRGAGRPARRGGPGRSGAVPPRPGAPVAPRADASTGR